MSRRTLRVSLLTVVLIASMGLGVLAGAWMPQDDDFFELRKNFQIFGAVYEELVTGYVQELDPERVMRVGIEAMLNDLDPYTTFIDEADNTDLSIITRGRYGGVGLNVGRRGGKITVLSPIEGASGYKQGVRAGDVITTIAGRATNDLSLNDVRTLLRGEPGTAVTITITREGAPAPITFTLTREEVELANVSYAGAIGDGSVGYVKLERFTREAGPEVRRAIRTLQDERRLSGVVLDLRGNPGGLLDAAVDVTELFVPRGSVIVSTRGRQDDSERVYRSDRTPMLPDLPLVVLVNDFSASASEIVAGAVQDLDRGVVLGTTTYGKGLVQVVRSLPHNTSLKMTTAKYYTPSGRSIQSIDYTEGDTSTVPDSLSRTFETAAGRTVRDQHGIEPDVIAETPTPGELEEALQRRAAFFFYANHYAATHDSLPAAFTDDAALLQGFREWLEAEDFDYPTDAETSVAKLASRFADDGYAAVQDEVAALKAAVREEKAADFQEHTDALVRHLRDEILSRFVSESRRIQAGLDTDVQVQAAATLIGNDGRYRAILTPEGGG